MPYVLSKNAFYIYKPVVYCTSVGLGVERWHFRRSRIRLLIKHAKDIRRVTHYSAIVARTEPLNLLTRRLYPRKNKKCAKSCTGKWLFIHCFAAQMVLHLYRDRFCVCYEWKGISPTVKRMAVNSVSYLYIFTLGYFILLMIIIANWKVEPDGEKTLQEPLMIGGNRLPKMFNDPLFSQDLDYIDKCRAVARYRDIDFTLVRPLWSFQVIEMKRFYEMYCSRRMDVRLSPGKTYNRRIPVVLVFFCRRFLKIYFSCRIHRW